MKHLLIVHHTKTGNTGQLADAGYDGATDPRVEVVDVPRLTAAAARCRRPARRPALGAGAVALPDGLWQPRFPAASSAVKHDRNAARNTLPGSRADAVTALFRVWLPRRSHAESAVKGRVADLAWMTGSWTGAFGEQTLEETWIPPAAGTIACLVRLTGNGATGMVELILIEDVEDSLVFRVRQFFPGLEPRRPEPQVMKLTEFGDRRVGFSGTGDLDFRTLTYSSPAADRFTIDAETMAGEKLQLNLRPR